MYNNGKKVNGYARKQLHKNKMKKRYCKKFYYCSGAETTWNELVAKYENYPDWNGRTCLDYWRDWFISGKRKDAKRFTSHKIRASFRREIVREDFEDITNLTNSDYRKYFDYWWYIF